MVEEEVWKIVAFFTFAIFLLPFSFLRRTLFPHFAKSTTKIKQIWLFPIKQHSESERLLPQSRMYIYVRMGHCVRVIFMWTIFITECEVDHKLQKWRPIKEVIESHMRKKDQAKFLSLFSSAKWDWDWMEIEYCWRKFLLELFEEWFWVKIYWRQKRDIEMEMMISQFLLS